MNAILKYVTVTNNFIWWPWFRKLQYMSYSTEDDNKDAYWVLSTNDYIFFILFGIIYVKMILDPWFSVYYFLFRVILHNIFQKQCFSYRGYENRIKKSNYKRNRRNPITILHLSLRCAVKGSKFRKWNIISTRCTFLNKQSKNF